MALDPGDAACSKGLSKRIYDNLCANWLADMSYNLPAQGATAEQMWKLVCYSVGQAVVDEIQANAEIVNGVAMVGTTGAFNGLQRDADGLNPNCLAPTIAKQIPVTGEID